ncbi:MAG: sigma-E processing peptidase SpoIIGA [Clostridia bacterium]|nr:sigma-E processing peptidase SpoIIGA [Clostridia bacterium]
MEIIIEYVLIDNLVIDFLILYISCKLLKCKIVFWKLAVSSLIGAGCALVLPIIILPNYGLIIFKLTLGVLMVLISLPSQTFKKALSSFMVFLMMTGSMGGLCFFLIFMLSGSLSADVLITYSSNIPIGVIIFMCALISFGVTKLTKLFYQKKNINNFIYETIFSDKGREIKINAFLDSGNTLIDPISQKPVVIINYSLFHRLYNLPLEKILTKNIEKKDIKNLHYITFNTIGKRADMLVFEVDKMEVVFSKNETKNFNDVVLGLSFSGLNKTFSCDALLHPQFVCE